MQQIILTSFNCITKSLKIELHKYLPSYPGKRKVHSIFPHNKTDIQNMIWRRPIVVHRFTDFSKILHSVSKNLHIFFHVFLHAFFYMHVLCLCFSCNWYAIWWIYSQETCLCVAPFLCHWHGRFFSGAK